MSRDIRKEKEKIEYKGAYSYDLHRAIRRVSDSLGDGNIDRAASRLEALRDICPPEVREAVNSEWIKIDKKYDPILERVRYAGFEVGCSLGSGKTGWVKYRGGGETYYTGDEVHATPTTKREIAESRRSEMLKQIWAKVLHEKLQACINCLDWHGLLREWREVDHGKL